jgi:hypothetical protein
MLPILAAEAAARQQSEPYDKADVMVMPRRAPRRPDASATADEEGAGSAESSSGTRVCSYHAGPGGCKKGAECAFSHIGPSGADTPDDKSSAADNADPDAPPAPQICHYHHGPRGCRKGSRCEHIHIGPSGAPEGTARDERPPRDETYRRRPPPPLSKMLTAPPQPYMFVRPHVGGPTSSSGVWVPPIHRSPYDRKTVPSSAVLPAAQAPQPMQAAYDPYRTAPPAPLPTIAVVSGSTTWCAPASSSCFSFFFCLSLCLKPFYCSREWAIYSSFGPYSPSLNIFSS